MQQQNQRCLGPQLNTWNGGEIEIQDITPSRNILSAPALSLDRLKIRFGKRAFILVSPEDKDGFLRAVKEAQGH